MAGQLALFGADPTFPEGFKYQADLITPAAEAELVANICEFPFREFEFHGYVGKRRVVSYGWKYDFNDRRLHKADDMPPFLRSLREMAAAIAGMAPERLQLRNPDPRTSCRARREASGSTAFRRSTRCATRSHSGICATTDRRQNQEALETRTKRTTATMNAAEMTE